MQIDLNTVRNVAFESIQELKNGKLDISTAKEIRANLDTIINTSKVQVDFLNALPDHIKKQLTKDNVLSITSSVHGQDPELDNTLKEIQEDNRKPYELM